MNLKFREKSATHSTRWLRVCSIVTVLLLNICTPPILAGYDLNRYTLVTTANQVINEIDYLPFSSISDGCYARALYMGMELAVKGIPTHNLYIMGKLRPVGAKWNWHVAPSIKVASAGTDVIFDPSLSKYPMTTREWIDRSHSLNKPQIEVAPVTHYRWATVQSFAQQQKPGYTKNTLITDFDRLPKFKIADIADACRTAWKHIGKEALNDDQKRAKRSRLKERTDYLIDHLMEVEKLDLGARITSCPDGKYIEGWANQ